MAALPPASEAPKYDNDILLAARDNDGFVVERLMVAITEDMFVSWSENRRRNYGHESLMRCSA